MLKDALNHPIRVGDTVLTNYYNTPIMGLITKVIKITKRKVFVKVERNNWVKNTTTGNWDRIFVDDPIARYSHQVIVIDHQLEYNRTNFPENFV